MSAGGCAGLSASPLNTDFGYRVSAFASTKWAKVSKSDAFDEFGEKLPGADAFEGSGKGRLLTLIRVKLHLVCEGIEVMRELRHLGLNFLLYAEKIGL